VAEKIAGRKTPWKNRQTMIWSRLLASISMTVGMISSKAAPTMVGLRPSRSTAMPTKGADKATAKVLMPTMPPATAGEMWKLSASWGSTACGA